MVLSLSIAAAHHAHASDPPEMASWKLNLTGVTGYGGLPANVQRVRYSTGSVYINCSSIPEYSIGPWPGNPNTPTDQAYLLRFPRSPVENTGAKTSTPLGPIGAWSNGVAIFNALDARSYDNQNIWHQNAVVVEAPSFDACLGHPAPSGTYHHHQNASCLYGANPSWHSPLLGYAFDGFPVYGPYGYLDPDGSGGIARIRSSYALRDITVRQTLPDGTVLTPSQYGPPVSSTYPLGYYVEDFEYIGGRGELDAYNGRFAVTPEYPAGTYAYYTTVDSAGNSEYPYEVGPRYYGVVATDDITAHGHVTISEPVADYLPPAGIGDTERGALGLVLRQSYPNPGAGMTSIGFTLPAAAHVTLKLYDVAGHEMMTLSDGMRPAGVNTVVFDASRFPAGVYFYRLRTGGRTQARQLLILR
jgi:hypothetical protein